MVTESMPESTFPINSMQRKEGKKPLRCDILLKHAITGDSLYYDMKVTHPNRAVPSHCHAPLDASEAGYKQQRAIQVGKPKFVRL